MINHLKGRVTERGKDSLVLECQGIGFRIIVTGETLRNLPQSSSSETTVLTHLQMRDGGAELYGFASEEERELFHALTGVAGVGPKSGMGVLSFLGTSGVVQGALRGDAKLFSSVPGIGKKLAQRMVAELPDRLGKISQEVPSASVSTTGIPPLQPDIEAIEALVALGYARVDAQSAVSTVAKQAGASNETEKIIRDALSFLSGRR